MVAPWIKASDAAAAFNSAINGMRLGVALPISVGEHC